MTMQRTNTLVSVAALAALTAACSSDPVRSERMPAPAVSSAAEAQTAQFGRVTDIQTTERKAVTGRVLGAVIGAAVGSQVGSGTGRAAATGAGALGGAVAGNQIDERRAEQVYRVTVRFDDGSTREFDFERVDELRVGDRVKWENGQIYRV